MMKYIYVLFFVLSLSTCSLGNNSSVEDTPIVPVQEVSISNSGSSSFSGDENIPEEKDFLIEDKSMENIFTDTDTQSGEEISQTGNTTTAQDAELEQIQKDLDSLFSDIEMLGK